MTSGRTAAAQAGPERNGNGPPSSGTRNETRILVAATDVFLKRGYIGASMDVIARKAGTSKQTVYHHFGSKDALFAAVVKDRCAAMVAPLATLETKVNAPGDTLRLFATRCLESVLAPSGLALCRILVAEAARFPELGRLAYRSGPAVAIDRLSSYLEDQTRRGHLQVREPRVAAEQFFGMLTRYLQLRALLSVDERPSPQAIERRVEHAVDIFLRAVLPRA